MSPETLAKIASWRQAALEGTLSLEDMKAAIHLLREERMAAATTAKEARKAAAKPAKVVPSAESLLDEIEE